MTCGEALCLLLGLGSLALGACAPQTVATPEIQVQVQTQVVKETQLVKETQIVKETRVVVVTPTPGPHPEALIQGVEPDAEITLWTFWLSPTFDDNVKSTIARFNEAYPGVTVNWEDHQATFQDDLKASFAAARCRTI